MKTEPFSLASATDTCFFNTLIRVIRYDEGAGTGIPKIRIRSLQTGAVDVEMIPGRLVRLPEPVAGIVITNLTGGAITGKITMGAGDVTDNSVVGTVDLGTGTLTALENIDLNAATLATMRQPLQETGFFTHQTAIVANTPVNVFTPVANANGAILLSASISLYNVGSVNCAFLTKNANPANPLDGSHVLSGGQNAGVVGSAMGHIPLTAPQFIAAGQGLYFISDAAIAAVNGWRACRYRLL